MSKKDDKQPVGSEIKAIVPLVYFACGWSCRDRPQIGYWESPCGMYTFGDSRYGVPYGPDRWILLYLAAMGATRGAKFQGSLREIVELFSLPWSQPLTLARLQRVVYCWIEPQVINLDMAPRYAIARRFRLFGEGTFEIVLTPEFVAEIEHGAPYSFAHVRQMGRSYATLDLYLWQRWSLHHGEKHIDKPERYLWFAQESYKRYQQLRERGERVRQIWPESPYYWCYDRCTLAFRQHRRGRARRPESAQSSRAAGPMQRPRRTGEIKQIIAERAAALASHYQVQGIATVPAWKRRERERAREHNNRPVDERLKALVERTERIAAALGRDSLDLSYDIATRSLAHTPASEPPQDAAVPPWKLRQSRARNRNGGRASTDARSSLMLRMERYEQLNEKPHSKAAQPAQEAVQAGDTSTPPVPARDATRSQPPETDATALPDHEAQLDPYATIARTFELSEAAQDLITQQKAALLPRARQTAPASRDTAHGRATPRQSRAAPGEQSSQVSASIETARRMFKQISEALRPLVKAALAYQPQ